MALDIALVSFELGLQLQRHCEMADVTCDGQADNARVMDMHHSKLAKLHQLGDQ